MVLENNLTLYLHLNSYNQYTSLNPHLSFLQKELVHHMVSYLALSCQIQETYLLITLAP